MRLLPCLLVFMLWLASIGTAHAQVRPIVRDTTPIENLDYNLSKQEFYYYYGVDDTSRALIHLFFRKRVNAVVNILLPTVPSAGCIAIELEFGGCGIFGSLDFLNLGPVALIGGVLFSTAYITRGIVQRLNYNKQALLYILVDRERGGSIAREYFMRLKEWDFDRR